jgi:hypothetical protein
LELKGSITMPEQIVGSQVDSSQQQQPQQQRETPPTPSISAFIVDDVKLFVSPVKAIVNEFIKQVKKAD